MKTTKVLLMNDQIDQHGERMSLSDLKLAKEQTNSKIMSSHLEHDYRSPPIARVKKAYILNDNGTNSLYGEIEYFDIEDIGNEKDIKGRELAIHTIEKQTIAYDLSYENDELIKLINELQKLISDEPAQFELKKSLEPVSTLTFVVGVVAFIGSGFVGGFLQKAGGDFWDKLKEIINKNKSINNNENIYILNGIVEKDYYRVEIIINFTNPEEVGIEEMLKIHSDEIDTKINEYYEQSKRIKRIVFNSIGNKIVHVYSVHRNGIPFDIRDMNAYKKMIKLSEQRITSNR